MKMNLSKIIIFLAASLVLTSGCSSRTIHHQSPIPEKYKTISIDFDRPNPMLAKVDEKIYQILEGAGYKKAKDGEVADITITIKTNDYHVHDDGLFEREYISGALAGENIFGVVFMVFDLAYGAVNAIDYTRIALNIYIRDRHDERYAADHVYKSFGVIDKGEFADRVAEEVSGILLKSSADLGSKKFVEQRQPLK